LIDVPKIKFTKHVIDKFEMVKRYGFEITNKHVVETVLSPERLDKSNHQYFAVRVINSKYALRVVYEKRKGYLFVITFYPVRRERYGV